VKTQSINTTRSFAWEDEAPEELIPRRVKQGVPHSGRALPSITLESEDTYGDELPLKGKSRFGGPSKPRWRRVKAAGRVFLTLAALGGLTTCVFFLYTFLSRDARFRIAGTDNIEATGLTEVSRAEMLPVFGEDIGRNIFFVPLAERRRQLEEIPWVEKATVMRLLPDQIRVTIVERKPVAFVLQPDGRTGLVDSSGVMLTMPAAMMAQRHYSFPVVTGIHASDLLATRKARMAVYQRLLAELDANNQHFSAQISEIDLTDPMDARVLMPEQGGDILAHFGQEHFLERYQRYKAGINEWRQQHPDLVSVDLRYEQIAAVLSMPVGTNAAQAAGGEQVADSGQNAVKPAEKQASGAKARVDSAGIVRGLKPPPPSGSSLSAASKAPAGNGTSKAKAKPAGKGTAKVKATAARNTSGLARTVKINAQEKKRAEAKRTALNINKQKIAPTIRPASSAAQGQ
jgi:cell division protein FtsQ